MTDAPRAASIGRLARGLLGTALALMACVAVPDAMADGPPDRAAVAKQGRGIHDTAAIRRYLLTRAGLGANLRRECAGAAPLTSTRIAYARLLGTRDEQALVEATSCLMGNGGADIVAVLRRTARGTFESLAIDDSGRPAAELFAGQRRTPRLQSRDGVLIRWFVKDGASPTDAPVRREIRYRWAGDRFVIDAVTDTPDTGR